MLRGTGEPAGLYVLCRIRWPDRCRRFLQSAPAPGDTLGHAHPFHYTVARDSPAPAAGELCQAQPARGCIGPANNDTLGCLLPKFFPNPAWDLGIPAEAQHRKQEH